MSSNTSLTKFYVCLIPEINTSPRTAQATAAALLGRGGARWSCYVAPEHREKCAFLSSLNSTGLNNNWLLAKVLPLAQNLYRRIGSISPRCMRCNEENEYEVHCFFFCPGSRMVWFGGQLTMRPHDLPLDIMRAFKQLITGLNDDQIKIAVITLWEIWKGRNEVFMQHKQFDPSQICRNITRMCAMQNGELYMKTNGLVGLKEARVQVGANDWHILVDASWATNGDAGTAFVIYRGGVAMFYGYNHHRAQDPFHAEALALLEATQQFLEIARLQETCFGHFHSDNMVLVRMVGDNNMVGLPSWQSAPTVHKL